MSTLNLSLRLLIYSDSGVTSNPLLRDADRTLQVQGVTVRAPQAYHLEGQVPAGASFTVFDGTRTTGFASDTELEISLSPLGADRYRLAWTGVGTNPAFRVERAFAAAGHSLTLTLNSNLTITVTGSGPTYGAVSVGDVVLIPGAATGDSALFAASNVGYWVVLGASGSSITLGRAAGWAGGQTETVAVTSNDQFIVMAPDRVQEDDQVEILGGFSTNARRSYRVLAVSPRWLDIQSSVALAEETAVAGANGLAAYQQARGMLLVESDQALSLRMNGGTADTDVIEPQVWPDGTRKALSFKTGPVWKLVVVSKSTLPVSAGLVLVA